MIIENKIYQTKDGVSFWGNVKTSDCLFIDVETVPVDSYDNVSTLPKYEHLWKLWQKRVEMRIVKGEIAADHDDRKTWDTAAIYPEYNKVVCVSIGMEHNGEFKTASVAGHNEHDIIYNMLGVMSKIKAKHIVGANIDGFDLPLLFKKCVQYGYMPDHRIAKFDQKPWDSPMIDITVEWRRGKYNGDATLDSMCRILGVESPKGDMTGADVPVLYEAGQIERIAEYCEKDVVAVYKIFKILGNLKVVG